MYRLQEMFSRNGEAGAYATQYFRRLVEVMATVDPAALDAVAAVLEETIECGGAIYVIANGGSAAVASHFVNDAVAGAWVEGAPPIRAYSLADNAESITAIANDCGFEYVFVNQLKMLMRPGDLVIAMSVSGNSPNLVRALEWANANGGRTVAWTGMSGGRLAELAQHGVHMPTGKDEYGPVEDMFSILEHALMTWLALKRGRKLHH